MEILKYSDEQLLDIINKFEKKTFDHEHIYKLFDTKYVTSSNKEQFIKKLSFGDDDIHNWIVAHLIKHNIGYMRDLMKKDILRCLKYHILSDLLTFLVIVSDKMGKYNLAIDVVDYLPNEVFLYNSGVYFVETVAFSLSKYKKIDLFKTKILNKTYADMLKNVQKQ